MQAWMNGTTLRHVKWSGEADVPTARRRVERLLAEVDGVPPGLPPRALLLVRRLDVRLRPGARAQVREALCAVASRARRPWLHGREAAAEAVWFADEAELAACVLREQLAGAEPAWWCRSVWRAAGAQAWQETEVLRRGEVLVAALSLLAEARQAGAWARRLAPAQAATVLRAVMQSHGAACADAGSGPLHGREESPVHERAAVARLKALVPEALEPGLQAPQRTVLAVALGARRAPLWGATREFAEAAQVLVAHVDAPRAVLHRAAAESVGTARSQVPWRPRAEADAAATEVEGRWTGAGAEAWQAALPSLPVAMPARAPAAEPASGEQPALAPPASPGEAARQTSDAAPASPDEPAVKAHRRAPVEQARSIPLRDEARPAESLHTAYGGLFYLLNVALALRLYGDFTMPRHQGLSLSPWTWLARVGYAWFGESLVRDPLWNCLAALAEKDLRRGPGRRWWTRHLRRLDARLRLALGSHAPKEAEALHALIARHPAQVRCAAVAVDVVLSLVGLPLCLRIAGLDRDPGWLPAAGRSIALHFLP